MQPIPESAEMASVLTQYNPDFDVLQHLQDTADRVQAVVPDCVGLSIAWIDQGVAFTLVASTEEIAVLDGVQYLDGGPCVDAVDPAGPVELSASELMDEDRWRMFAQATAHQGIASTLTLPLVHDGEVVGSINLYASTDRAFEGHHEQLSAIVGGDAQAVVANADLTFSTRRAAEEAPSRLQHQETVDTAVGLLVGVFNVDADEAASRLSEAAAKAGIGVVDFARALVGLYQHLGE